MRATRRPELILFLLTAVIAMGLGLVLGQRGPQDDPLAGAGGSACTYYPDLQGQQDVTGLAASLLGAISPSRC